MFGFNAHERLFFVDQLLIEHVNGDFHRSHTGSFANPALEHEELVVLDGELNVHHVVVVVFENGTDLFELVVNTGVICLELFNFQRGSCAGHNVLSLCIHEKLTVEDVFAGGCIAGEGDACAAIFAHVTEDHGLHVAGGAPVAGNMVQFAVHDGSFVVPTVEDGADGSNKLFVRIFRECFAGFFKNGGFVFSNNILEIFDREFSVELYTEFFFFGFKNFFEGVNLLFVGRFEIKHHVTVHLYEAAVAVPCKTGVS